MALNPAYFENTSDSPRKKDSPNKTENNQKENKVEVTNEDILTFDAAEFKKLIQQAFDEGYKKSQKFDQKLGIYTKKAIVLFNFLMEKFIYLPNLLVKLFLKAIVYIFQLLLLAYRLLLLLVTKLFMLLSLPLHIINVTTKILSIYALVLIIDYFSGKPFLIQLIMKKFQALLQ